MNSYFSFFRWKSEQNSWDWAERSPHTLSNVAPDFKLWQLEWHSLLTLATSDVIKEESRAARANPLCVVVCPLWVSLTCATEMSLNHYFLTPIDIIIRMHPSHCLIVVLKQAIKPRGHALYTLKMGRDIFLSLTLSTSPIHIILPYILFPLLLDPWVP